MDNALQIDVSNIDSEKLVDMLGKIIKQAAKSNQNTTDPRLIKSRLTALALLSNGILKREDGDKILAKTILDNYHNFSKITSSIDSKWLSGYTIDPEDYENYPPFRSNSRFIQNYLNIDGIEIDQKTLIASDYSEELNTFFTRCIENIKYLAESVAQDIGTLESEAPDFENFSFEQDTGITEKDDKFYKKIQPQLSLNSCGWILFV